MFTLEFAALNYNNQNRVSYKYILEGYEKEWHYNGKNRIASYTNVPPGKYLFRVQTLDEANPGLESFRELTVVILPPWWASWWAYVIYMIIAVALLLVAIKLSLFMIKVKNDVYIEQKLSELKIKFFTNISHELRTPLTLIQGPIQELREKEKLSQKGMQYVDLMEKNTKQMLQLVNQILDFRKIQNGKMRLHVSLFNLNEMVDSFEKEFRVMAEENEVSFTFQLAGEDIMVWADKEKVAIVIRNIISNAFKFTPAGGNIMSRWECRMMTGIVMYGWKIAVWGFPKASFPKSSSVSRRLTMHVALIIRERASDWLCLRKLSVCIMGKSMQRVLKGRERSLPLNCNWVRSITNRRKSISIWAGKR